MSEQEVNERVRHLLQQAVTCLSGSSPSLPATPLSAPAVEVRPSVSRPGPSWQRERNTLFNFGGKGNAKGKQVQVPKKKKSKKVALKVWNHDFICLAKRDMTTIPSAGERSRLITAGLGKKSLTLFQFGDSEDVHECIIEAFPQLAEAGGYELLRSGEMNRRSLEVIPVPPGGYTTEYLKESVHQARIYIRPMQKDLSFDVLLPSCSPVRNEKCLKCECMIPINKLKEHLVDCEKSVVNEEVISVDSSFSEDDLPGIHIHGPSDIEDADDTLETEDAMVEHALSLSESEARPCSLSNILEDLKRKLWLDYYEVEVRRDCVLDDLLKEARRSGFHPQKKIKTWFVGEEGVDTGGVTREMWTVFGHGLTRICEGDLKRLVFIHSPARVRNGDFRLIGMLFGMSLVQGGSGFPCFAPAIYGYICGRQLNDLSYSIDDIPEFELRTMLEQMMTISDNEHFRQYVSTSDVSSALIDAGWSKPLINVTMSDLPGLICTVALNSVILKIKAELDDFICGLEEAGVLIHIRSHPSMFQPLFVSSESHLTAESLMKLFTLKSFSHSGSSSLVKEQATYIYFKDILHEIEGGRTEITLATVLSFFTGAEFIPPMGFDEVCLNFNSTNPYPTASTCGLILTLPTQYNDYADFKEKFLYAMQNHGGFGLA